MTALPRSSALLCIIVSALVVGLALALTLFKYRNDEVKTAKVPLRPVFTAWSATVALVVVGSFLMSNIQANDEAFNRRALNALMPIEASYTVDGTNDGPYGDIVGGNNDYESADFVAPINRGELVKLATKSGKPATVQLFGDGGDIVAVYTYDGKPLETPIAQSFANKGVNKSGYPQLIPASALPARA
jgi:hypothetical protein